MVLPVPLRGQPVVVELGAGTGPVTRAIRQRLAGRGRHLAVELNPRLASVLADRLPDVEVKITPPKGPKHSQLGDVTEVFLKGHCKECR